MVQATYVADGAGVNREAYAAIFRFTACRGGIVACFIHRAAPGGPVDQFFRAWHAADLFESIPAHGARVEALGYLGECHVRMGKVDEALAVLEESERLIARLGLRDHQTISTLRGRAEVCLAIAEPAHGAARAEALDRAARACRALLRLTRLVRPAYARACRPRGTLEWLHGRPAAAEKWWGRSVADAEQNECRYDLTRTHLERGRRTGRGSDLERAEAIFDEIGARLDLAEARHLLGRAPP